MIEREAEREVCLNSPSMSNRNRKVKIKSKEKEIVKRNRCVEAKSVVTKKKRSVLPPKAHLPKHCIKGFAEISSYIYFYLYRNRS